MSSVYVIYSVKLDKYYIGESVDIPNRISQHNNRFFKNSFTSGSDDWEIFLVIECGSRELARKIESHIKKMKSRKYIEDLKKYPEIVSKLIKKYN
ncbi:GIY-YIG nuclease family protein [Allomuricauda sp. M10]|uniref:GIY-YIG nuclease family protein n=1 Tax=Allomuricauda sp. M10 TaxID=2683292 RepID=UPI001D18FC50|nr:GIY-YIG nuclease family protein [Muricauda sp. M10]